MKFITDNRLNQFIAEDEGDVGLVVQGGHFNTLVRVLERLGLADVYGRTKLPLYVMNVAYPVIDAELLRFAKGKRAILVVEEGQPNFIEQNIATILRAGGATAALHGKDLLAPSGEYTAAEVLGGVRRFLQQYGLLPASVPAVSPSPVPALPVHNRPPGFCTGCPERPIFTAMKLVERELGEHHVSADIGCHLFSILPPFNLGNTTMGYGLGSAGAAALNDKGSAKRAISVMGDGGFWHNGLTSGIANAVFNKSDNLTIVVDNSYTSATGGQDILSSKAANKSRSTGHAIEQAVRGVGVEHVRVVTTHLRSGADEGGAERRADDQEAGAQGDRGAERMHAQPPAARKAAAAPGRGPR